MSLLVVMGSGETAPTMIKIHREVLAATRPGPGPALMLDTPFGFQMNADDLLERAAVYFRESVGFDIEAAAWRRRDAPAVDRERTLAALRGARWILAGPGSPSYALHHWQDTPIPAALRYASEQGATIVFSSAAACTLGVAAVPVYEIYKVGADPHWLPGLDLLGELTGLRAVVIPHYDNAEGGRHDTRFCYLGEQRLARMEADLPDDVGILGVDEHTALLLDLTQRHATVTGNGVVTVRHRGRSTTLDAGTHVSFDALAGLLAGIASQAGDDDDAPGPAQAPDDAPAGRVLPSLRRDADEAQTEFDTALAAADVDRCVAAVLALEAAIVAWSADTDVNDDADHARSLLRGMIVRLGELARVGARAPEDVIGPFVDLLLSIRERARQARDWTTSDLVRDRLTATGVEVRDTPDGVRWLPVAHATPPGQARSIHPSGGPTG